MKEKKDKNIEAKTGEKKSRRQSTRSKRDTVIYRVIFCVLGAVMLFSGYKIVSQLLEYKKGTDTYQRIEAEVIVTAAVPPSTFVRPTYNLPAEEPTGPAETIPPYTGEWNGTRSSYDETYYVLPGESSGGIDHPSVERPSSGPEETAAPETAAPVPETAAPAPAEPDGPQDLPWLNIDFAALKRINSDVTAWLQGGPSTINLPVVQGTDNDYYLKHLLDGYPNSNGTLFVDYRNNFLQDDITVIYGHKMKNGAMFGHLDYYDRYAYYRNHPYMLLYTPDAVYELQILSSFYTDEH